MKNLLLLLGIMAVVGCSCGNENNDHHDDNNMNHMNSNNDMMDHNNNNAMGDAMETMDHQNGRMDHFVQNQTSDASKNPRIVAMSMIGSNYIHIDYNAQVKFVYPQAGKQQSLHQK